MDMKRFHGEGHCKRQWRGQKAFSLALVFMELMKRARVIVSIYVSIARDAHIHTRNS